MTALPVSPTDDGVAGALRALLVSLFSDLASNDIMQGQQNRTPMPTGPDFIIFVPDSRDRMSTSIREYDPTAKTRMTSHSTRVGFMVNFYGPNSTDNAQIFGTLFRDLYGCDFLAPYGVQPLWSDDGRQMPLVSGEEQYIDRWMVRTMMQANPTVVTSQQFADNVTVRLIEADS